MWTWPFRRKDPQKSPSSFRSAVKDRGSESAGVPDKFNLFESHLVPKSHFKPQNQLLRRQGSNRALPELILALKTIHPKLLRPRHQNPRQARAELEHKLLGKEHAITRLGEQLAAQHGEIALLRLNVEGGQAVALQDAGAKLAAQDRALASKDGELARLGSENEAQRKVLREMVAAKDTEIARLGRENAEQRRVLRAGEKHAAGGERAEKKRRATADNAAHSYAQLGGQFSSRLEQVKQVPARPRKRDREINFCHLSREMP